MLLRQTQAPSPGPHSRTGFRQALHAMYVPITRAGLQLAPVAVELGSFPRSLPYSFRTTLRS